MMTTLVKITTASLNSFLSVEKELNMSYLDSFLRGCLRGNEGEIHEKGTDQVNEVQRTY